jgi:flavin reductase (DIM6/NTAB) family NADH-FMN oxidoreductase RutF
MVDPNQFKQVLSRWASGVSVITSTLDGRWHGMTASSFTSVSLEPPLVSVSLAKKLNTHALIQASQVFAVNILAADQIEIGKVFAGYYKDVQNRFEGLDCTTAVTGSPLLPGTLGWLDCKVVYAYEGGDHTIFVGEVQAANTVSAAPPLLYYSRAWGQFARLMPEVADVYEVGLRDGLQNESFVPTARKLDLIAALGDAGVKRIQVTAFVQGIPQFADAAALWAALPKRPDVTYSALVQDLAGLERALDAGVRAVDLSVSACPPVGETIESGLAMFERMAARALKAGASVRGGVTCAFGSPDGDIPVDRVAEMVERQRRAGAHEIALIDSSGTANPQHVRDLLCMVQPAAGDAALILHLLDTRGLGLANAVAALESGVRHFETTLGGLGGSPFVAGAAGNIATEDTLYMMASLGVSTGVDPARLTAASRLLERLIGRPLTAKMSRAALRPDQTALEIPAIKIM